MFEICFGNLRLKDIFAVCTADSIASENVVKKIGMKFVQKFEHPKLARFAHLTPCELYSIVL